MKKNQEESVKVSKILLSINAMTFRFNPPYVYTTGMKSPIYLDNRVILSYPSMRKKIIKEYIKVIMDQIGLKNVDYISATATAAIPQGSWVADKLNLPMVYVRPTTKAYGKGGKVEGVLKKGSRVVIIEDHITTAESVVNNAEAIRDLGGKVKYVIATTTYETEIAKNKLKEHKITLLPLTTGKITVDIAYKMKKITEKEKESVENWLKDPQNWAKNENFE